jgi:16S rRNA (cytosine967-C5)-methyltransferase
VAISPARIVAYSVLERVENGGYASDLLLAETAALDSRDAGLANEIVFGVLRRQAQLDYLIERQTAKPVSKLDAAVRISLRMGAYQLRHLDRVPAHAAVNESVQLVKRARKASAAGLVNAVLRKLPRGDVDFPNRAVALSQPQWLLDSWDAQFGRDITDRIGEAFLLPSEVYVRNPPQRPGLMLERAGVPGAYRVLAGDHSGLRIQDVGSQSVVPLLDLQPGMTFLDLCAAPGNKTAQALESGVWAVACDVHLHRLKHVSGCARVALDASAPLPFRGNFDRVLIDVPCSGTGTLGRNPEIRWRLQPSNLEELHRKQVEILRQALTVLHPAGRLVYSTCSLERRENEDVVQEVPLVKILETKHRIPGVEPGDGFFAAVLTSV